MDVCNFEQMVMVFKNMPSYNTDLVNFLSANDKKKKRPSHDTREQKKRQKVEEENQQQRDLFGAMEHQHTDQQVSACEDEDINPVKRLSLMNLKPEDFKNVRQKDGLFCITDAIAQFKGCNVANANEYLTRLDERDEITNCEFIKKVQFRRKDNRLGRAVACCTFSQLLTILAQLPGQAGKQLRAEQSEISTRAIAGDRDLEEAIIDQRENISENDQKVLMNEQSNHFQLMTLNQLHALNPQFQAVEIRIDQESQEASVIDVICLITGYEPKHASKIITRLNFQNNDLSTKCRQLRINGKGRPTWVATAPVLIELIWELPGRAAKEFRRQSAHLICRLLGGDASLVGEMESRFLQTDQKISNFFLSNTERPTHDPETEARIAQREQELNEEKNRSEIAIRFNNGNPETEGTLTMDTAAMFLKIQESHLRLVEHQTQQLKEKTQQMIQETQQLKHKEETEQIKSKEETERLRITTSAEVEKLKLKVPPSRTKNPLDCDRFRQLWEQKNGKRFESKCTQCNQRLSCISPVVKVTEDKQSNHELLHPSNIDFICNSCSRDHVGKCYKKRVNQTRVKCWLRTNGDSYEANCFACNKKKLVVLCSQWHAGHERSFINDGTTEISNLRPICADCNFSMKSDDMLNFIRNKRYNNGSHPGNIPYSVKDTEQLYKYHARKPSNIAKPTRRTHSTQPTIINIFNQS